MIDGIQYVGEHLWPGQIGRAAIFISFCAAILSGFAYFFATQQREDKTASNSWRKLGRLSFGVHGLATFLVIGLIFYIMVNNYYEYQYVQAHVDDDLQFRYIFSAFWEGQEGSFLLWMFWHVVLGGLLISSAKQFESPVMAVVSSVQVIIGSMLLGVYIGFGPEAFKVGSNPMLLLRDTMDIPLFANADYVTLLEGTGISPLLQNWWMTVHPPTLFLGFASTVVPFAFAIAGLWTKEHRAWLKPALPWALFSGAILGTGILMGGAWAYEALSFGGYWAWDPVENMSLVPWLTLVAGVHTNLIARTTDHSIRSTYVFYALTFILIVYSTFLTRSGVLGETSVHAFTEMGLEWQLVTFILLYLLMFGGLFISRLNSIPAPKKEESTGSKEFWMFIGSLVLLFSAFLISVSTSLPVYNKIQEFFDPGYVGSVITDPIPHYNKYQLWIAVFIGLLSGFSQFLRFREINFSNHLRPFLIHTGIGLALAVALTYLSTTMISLQAWQYKLMMFSGWFAVVTNVDHIISFLRGNLKAGGSAIAHIGFGLMLVGILFSGLNQEVISRNPFIMDGLTEDEEAKRNSVLLIKDSPVPMGTYEVTLNNDTIDYLTRTYNVNFARKGENGETIEEFQLTPNILYNKDFTKVAAANPSTRQYWNRDIFTHIVALPPEETDINEKKAKEDSLQYRPFILDVGELYSYTDTVPISRADTFRVQQMEIQLLEVFRDATHPDYIAEQGDLAVGAKIRVRSSELDEDFIADPVLVLRGEVLYNFPAQINPLNTRVKLNEEIFNLVYTAETELGYQEFELAQGTEFEFAGYKVQFAGFNKNVTLPTYEPQDGDIAVSAMFQVENAEGQVRAGQPVFLIRNSQPLNLKDEITDFGLHLRFVSLDPESEKARIFLAYQEPRKPQAAFSVATRSFRTDWIALQAIEFPGINYFWIGASLMMFGLTISMYHRIRQKRAVAS
ncbi:MAG: cytochrome c biogenesis protein CcsA [Bacteroidota bacterium]